MFAVILAVCGTFLDEVSSSIGKWKINHHKENIYTYGFLNHFWGLLAFLSIVSINGNFVFSLDSLPLFLVLIFLEVLQMLSSLHAIAESERGTFAFIMTLTIPIVLLGDYFLGYQLGMPVLLGICFVVFGILVLVFNHGLSKKGIGYVIFSTVNGGIATLIYKYLITNYNSVEGQQIVSYFILTLVIFAFALAAEGNPFRFVFKKGYFLQSFSHGLAGVPLSFAYHLAPASVVMSAKRGSALLWAIASGKAYFKEKHLMLKIISSSLILLGFALLVM